MRFAVTPLIRHMVQSALYLAFPPICVHCHSLQKEPGRVLCSCCASQMPLLYAKGRCLFCFSELDDPALRACAACIHKPPPWSYLGSACDYMGPAKTLVKALKYAKAQHVVYGMAGYLMLQLDALNWPLPDLLAPVPMPWLRRLQRGYNQSMLLARVLGKWIKRPVAQLVKREAGSFPQAGQPLQKRRQLTECSFSLRKRVCIEDKTVLLIDDVLTSGSTLFASAKTLRKGYPRNIYVMTFARV